MAFASLPATAQVISTVAGDGTAGFGGDGGPATSAQLGYAVGVAVDSAGNVYFAETGNRRIRKVTPGGIISTVAGDGTPGFSGDGGPATSAQLNFPVDVAVDSAGNLYIADNGNSRIRKVTPGGIISTVVGNGTAGDGGDGGLALNAELSGPMAVTVDGAGHLYIAVNGSSKIRKVDGLGIISTLAGDGTQGFSGDDGPATSAQLHNPIDVAVDSAGNLYIADAYNYRVRKVTPGGVISTVAGDGGVGFSGDGGPATSAPLGEIAGVAVDGAGQLHITAGGGSAVRKVDGGGLISTVAGDGTFGFGGDGGLATSAQLNGPFGMAFDSAGNLYIVDNGNFRIRKVAPPPAGMGSGVTPVPTLSQWAMLVLALCMGGLVALRRRG